MKVPIALSLTALAVSLAAAAPTPAKSTTHCRPQKHERRVAVSARYAVLLRTADHGETGDELLYGCDRRSGATAALGDGGWDFSSDRHITAARLAGRHVAFHVAFVDYHDGVVEDSLGAGDVTRGAEVLPIRPGTVGSWALSDRGDVAWTGDGALHVWRATGRSMRLLDEGLDLDALAYRPGGALTWHHDGTPRSAPAVAAASRCPAGATSGTPDIDVYAGDRARPELPTALCWRATGRRLDLAPGGSPALAGRYAARRVDTAIERYDLATGAVTTIPALDAVDVRVDEAGDLAWRSSAPEGDEAVAVWVADAFGTKRVGTTRWTAPFHRDGALFVWGPAAGDKYQLVHGAAG